MEEGCRGRSGALVAAAERIVAGWPGALVGAGAAGGEEGDVAPRDDDAGAGAG